MASSETFDVILRLLMDEAALGRIKNGASTVAKEFEKVDDKTEEITKEIQRQEKIAIAAMKKEARAINSLAALRSKELKELKERADWIERGSKAMFAVGVAGLASITAIAKKYIDSTEESNAITQAWAESTEKVNDAQTRIGKIAAEAVLPIYEKLADIAQKGAEFVEKNPGAIEAGLKASMVLAGLGGLGLLAAKGLRLYADVKMIAVGDMQLLAAKLMSDAATKQLAAAGGGSGIAKSVGVGGQAVTTATTATVAAGGLSAGAIAAIVAGVTAGQVALASLGQAIGNLLGLSEKTTDSLLFLGSAGIYPLFKNLGEWINKQLGITKAVSTSTKAQNENINTTMRQAEANRVAAKASADGTMGMRALAQSTVGMTNVAISASNALVTHARNLVNAVNASSGGGVGSRESLNKKYGGGNSYSIHDYTGYAYKQTYRMAQDGKRQFVLSGGMTRLAEQMLGSQLNEQMVMSALASGAGRGSVTWNDQRRFSGEYTKSMRNAQRRDTLEIFSEVAKNIKG